MPILGAGSVTPTTGTPAPTGGTEVQLNTLIAQARKLRERLMYPGTSSGERTRINQQLAALQNQMVKLRNARTFAESKALIESKHRQGQIKLPEGVFRAMEKAGYKLWMPETGIVTFVGGKGGSGKISGYEALRRWKIAKGRIAKAQEEVKDYKPPVVPDVAPSIIDDANRIARQLQASQGLTTADAAKKATTLAMAAAAEKAPAQAATAPATGAPVAGGSGVAKAALPAALAAGAAWLAWQLF